MSFKKIKSKQYIIVGAVILFIAIITGAVFWTYQNLKTIKTPVFQTRPPQPQGNAESSFLYQEVGYECSRKIPGEWKEASIGPNRQPGWYFVPNSQSDLQKYCRTNFVIEYRAVIDILKREDINKVIKKYDIHQAWVKALGHAYIHDKDYLKRILPAYSNIQIDCIIVVHSPEGTRFFIEDGDKHTSHDDHQYREIPAKEFLESLNNAPDSDINNFWLGLH